VNNPERKAPEVVRRRKIENGSKNSTSEKLHESGQIPLYKPEAKKAGQGVDVGGKKSDKTHISRTKSPFVGMKIDERSG